MFLNFVEKMPENCSCETKKIEKNLFFKLVTHFPFTAANLKPVDGEQTSAQFVTEGSLLLEQPEPVPKAPPVARRVERDHHLRGVDVESLAESSRPDW